MNLTIKISLTLQRRESLPHSTLLRLSWQQGHSTLRIWDQFRNMSMMELRQQVASDSTFNRMSTTKLANSIFRLISKAWNKQKTFLNTCVRTNWRENLTLCKSGTGLILILVILHTKTKIMIKSLMFFLKDSCPCLKTFSKALWKKQRTSICLLWTVSWEIYSFMDMKMLMLPNIST